MKTLLLALLVALPCLASDFSITWDASITPGITNYAIVAHTNAITATNVSQAVFRANAGTNLVARIEGLAAGQWFLAAIAMKDGISSDPSPTFPAEVPQPPARTQIYYIQFGNTMTNLAPWGYFKVWTP